MIVDRKQQALEHILKDWPKGCECELCKAVDSEQSIEEFFNRGNKKFQRSEK